MGKQEPKAVSVIAGNSPQFLARVDDQEGDLLLQASVTSIAWALYDDADTLVDSGAAVVSSSIFDTLQVDSRWTADSVGYNFLHQPSISDHLTHAVIGRVFRLEYVFTLPNPSPSFTLAFVIEVL